jgi:transposase-like protein
MAEGRVLPPEFRVAVAERLLNGESASALSGELQIKRSVLYRWRDRYRKEGAEGLNRPRGRPPGDGVPAGKGKKASTGPLGPATARSQNWNGGWGSWRWRTIF